eukprot:7358112-Pyramimonas_sp.AAC.1
MGGRRTCEGCAEMVAVVPCERSQRRLRWGSLWGATKRGMGVSTWARKCRASAAVCAVWSSP